MRSDACAARRRSPQWRSLILALAFLVVAFGGSDRTRAAELIIGQLAPPLALHTLDGGSVATSDLRGKVVILTFWATWCAPCRIELPLLADYAARHRNDGLQILGFSLDDPDTLSEVKRIAATLNFPVGLLGSAWAGDYGRMWRLPVSFVIDRQGILRHDGWKDEQEPWSEARLDRVVTPLLGAGAAR